MPMTTSTSTTNRPKLSAATTPKLGGVAVPQQDARATAGADEADERRGRRSASARRARGTPRRASRRCPRRSRTGSGRWRRRRTRTSATSSLPAVAAGSCPRGAAGVTIQTRPAGRRRPSALPQRLSRLTRCSSALDRRLHRPEEQLREHAHQDRRRHGGHDHRTTRARVRSGSAAFSSLVTGPVVHALEHPQHVDGRQDDAGGGDGREARVPRGTRRAGSGTRRRSRSGRAGRSTTA